MRGGQRINAQPHRCRADHRLYGPGSSGGWRDGNSPAAIGTGVIAFDVAVLRPTIAEAEFLVVDLNSLALAPTRKHHALSL
jgi:hypothetical protein